MLSTGDKSRMMTLGACIFSSCLSLEPLFISSGAPILVCFSLIELGESTTKASNSIKSMQNGIGTISAAIQIVGLLNVLEFWAS